MSIVSDRDPRFMTHILEKFSMSHGDIVDDEHNFSSPDERSIREDHPDFRGEHASLISRVVEKSIYP